MCYRHLRFNKFLECGHLTFTGDTYFDCNERVCFLSTSHPADCGTNGKPACKCRRYYTQPLRFNTDCEGKCGRCLGTSPF